MKKLPVYAALFSFLINSVSAFSDVRIDNSKYLPVTYLTEKAVIKGYEDGSFGLEKAINRAESLKVILVSANKKINENFAGKFKDVPQESWFAGFVETAADMGIVSGDAGTGAFVPSRQVNKAEFLKMVLKSFDINPDDYASVLNVIPADVNEGDWFSPYVKFAAKFEIINLDTDSKANPAKFLSRGEAVDILFKTLNKGRGLDPQVLLNVGETHLINTINLLEKGDLLNAGINVGIAEKTMEILNSFLPKNSTVKSSTKITESIKNLVGAYVSGNNGQVEKVIESSGNAWQLADEAEKVNAEQTVGITAKIKHLAHSLAEKARNTEESSE